MRGEEEERCEGKKRDGKQERRDEEKERKGKFERKKQKYIVEERNVFLYVISLSPSS